MTATDGTRPTTDSRPAGEPDLVYRVGTFGEELRRAPRSVRWTLYIRIVFTAWLLIFMMVFIPWVVSRWGFSYNLN